MTGFISERRQGAARTCASHGQVSRSACRWGVVGLVLVALLAGLGLGSLVGELAAQLPSAVQPGAGPLRHLMLARRYIGAVVRRWLARNAGPTTIHEDLRIARSFAAWPSDGSLPPGR